LLPSRLNFYTQQSNKSSAERVNSGCKETHVNEALIYVSENYKRTQKMGELEYLIPKNFEEIFGAIEKTKGLVKFIAGGTNIIPYMRAETMSPELLIDLNGLEDLKYIKEESGAIAIGALTSISDIVESEVVRNKCQILHSAAKSLGSPLTRNRATIGGNLADASPAADMAPPLLVLEASIHTKRGREEGREIPLDQFFLGPNKTVLAENELITQISFSKPKDSAKGIFIKLGLRNSLTISVVSIAVILEMEGQVCQKARVALGAVAPTIIRVSRVENKLEGREIDENIIQECTDIVKEEISPISDIRASAEYRRSATSVMLKRAIQQLAKGERL
jgi:CO/xanthine dehydrogenase FAD-binding subunit